MAEWFKAAVLKTARGLTLPRGFESHPFRQKDRWSVPHTWRPHSPPGRNSDAERAAYKWTGRLRQESATTTAIVLLATIAFAVPVAAAELYAGKSVDLNIGYGPGGGYDLYGRLAACHLDRHIPGNPQVVARNMPGAGGLKVANYLNHLAPAREEAKLASSLANQQVKMFYDHSRERLRVSR